MPQTQQTEPAIKADLCDKCEHKWHGLPCTNIHYQWDSKMYMSIPHKCDCASAWEGASSS